MRKKADRGGLAAIVDALVFLCIISAITLTILASPDNGSEGEAWDQSAMVHSVLVHSTISTMEVEVGEEHSEAPISQLICMALASKDHTSMDRVKDRVEPISSALVEIPYHYRWVITGTYGEIAMGESIIPYDRDIMASTMNIGGGENACTSMFYLWIL